MRCGSADGAVGADHAVCGNEQVERRARHCGRDGAVRSRRTDDPREVAVRHDLSPCEAGDAHPDRALKLRSFECERQIEPLEPLAQVRTHLCGRFAQQGIGRTSGRRRGPSKAARGDGAPVTLQGERSSERRFERDGQHKHPHGFSLQQKWVHGAQMNGNPQAPALTEAEERERREATDQDLDAYDKADADSFPASDPPVQP